MSGKEALGQRLWAEQAQNCPKRESAVVAEPTRLCTGLPAATVLLTSSRFYH